MVKKKKKDFRTDNPQKFKFEKTNPWMWSTVILLILCIVFLLVPLKGEKKVEEKKLTASDIKESLIKFLNSKTGGGVGYVIHEKEGEDLYKVTVSYKGQEIPVFITKDGKYFVQGVIPLTEVSTPVRQNPETEAREVPKTDKPKVELFVMTYCPYGAQAEKGIIPVFKTLGDKIDSKVRFVHYFMHGDKEEKETYTQVCIREEQADKYLDYLECFLKEGDSEGCIEEVKINKAKLEECKDKRAKDYYAEDSELSKSYGVRGSPTLVVNGQIVSSARDSASYLETLCSAFNKPPEECNEELSDETPQPGFGYSSTSSSSSSAQCG